MIVFIRKPLELVQLLFQATGRGKGAKQGKKIRARESLALPTYITEEQGFEPRPAEPESAVLPLDDSPILGDILAFSVWIGKFLKLRHIFWTLHSSIMLIIKALIPVRIIGQENLIHEGYEATLRFKNFVFLGVLCG